MTRKELRLILEEGEGYKIGFKEAPTGLDKEMVAFANSSGGRIFLGVSDQKRPVGVKITSRLKSRIQDTASNCQPAVKVLFHQFEDILILDAPTTLVNLGVAEKQEGRVIPNNAGILFFSKDLDKVYFHTTVTCALFKGTEKIDILDRRDFNEDLVSSIDRAMNFLKQYIPLRYEMTGGPRRREIPEIPYDALREAIINAVTHRNYFEKGANVMVEMYDDRIEITNPGGLPKGLKPEDFGKKSVLRNPNIANLLQRIGYIERMGTGIAKMRNLIEEAGLSPIEFGFGTFFTTVFRRPAGAKPPVDGGVFSEEFREKFSVNFRVKGKQLTRMVSIIERLASGRTIAVSELAREFTVSARTIYKDLGRLQEWGILTFKGAPKTGAYVLISKGIEIIKDLGE